MKIPNCCRTGVYKIVNLVNGKVYVGSATKGFRGRGGNHLSELRRGIHPNIYLQRAWNKNGEENFRFVRLFICPPEKCVEVEQRYIDLLKAADQRYGYNLCPTAGSRFGTKHSEESKRKMSLTKLGKKMPPEACARMSASGKGRKFSEEYRAALKANHWTKRPDASKIRAAISKGNKGRPRSAEERAKISATKRKARWSTCPQKLMFTDEKES